MDKLQSDLHIIQNTPLVAVDLILHNEANLVLLGKRVNRPAKGYWFVPGGRIRKNERIEEALSRVALNEVGIHLTMADAELKGVYTHMYSDNFAGKDGIDTHYVVLAFLSIINENQVSSGDGQHEEFQWWTIDDLLKSSDVHDNVKAYFSR